VSGDRRYIRVEVIHNSSGKVVREVDLRTRGGKPASRDRAEAVQSTEEMWLAAGYSTRLVEAKEG
jgi:hypothetical protein